MRLEVLPIALVLAACSGDRAPATTTSSAAPVTTASATPVPKVTTASAAPAPTAAVDGGAAGGPGDAGEPWSGSLGLSGVGDNGGFGTGIGLGTLGHGFHALAPAAGVRAGAPSVHGRLPPEVIQRIVRQNFGWFRFCYEQALARDPALRGPVHVRFVIGKDGAVSTASADASLTDLPDPAMVACAVKGFAKLAFPRPEGGIVVVGYPLDFTPPPPAPAPTTQP